MKYSDLGIANIPDLLAPGWNTKNINGFVFDEQFQLEGIPLSWFLKRMLCAHTIPPQLNTKRNIEKYLRGENSAYTATDRLRTNLLRYMFYLNEKAKTTLSQRPEYSSPNKVLFLTSPEHVDPQTGHIFRIQEVLNQCESNSQLTPLILATSPLSQSFLSLQKQNSAHPLPLIYDYITPEIKRKAKKASTFLSQQWKNLNDRLKQQLFTVPLWTALHGVFDFYLSPEYLYFIFLYYETSKLILKTQNIRAVVITSQNSIFERCINAAGHKLQCPILLVQHGAAMGSIHPNLLEPYTIAVFSKKYKRELEQRGVPPKNIAIVGPVIFDEIYPFLKQKDSNPPKKNEASTSSRLLILTVPFIEQDIFTHQEYFSYLEKIVRESTTVASSVIIKLHPREKYYADYQQFIKKSNFPGVKVIQNNRRTFLYQLMSQSDLIINFSSTSAVEGMILDKLIVTVTFKKFSNPFNDVLKFSKATVEVPIEKDLTEALTEILSNLQLQKNLQQHRCIFVNEYCGPIDGKASERMMALIEKAATFKKTASFIPKNG